jgi:hypothetical protein
VSTTLVKTSELEVLKLLPFSSVKTMFSLNWFAPTTKAFSFFRLASSFSLFSISVFRFSILSIFCSRVNTGCTISGTGKVAFFSTSLGCFSVFSPLTLFSIALMLIELITASLEDTFSVTFFSTTVLIIIKFKG